MDSVNGTYMICPTINCYYLMYLHYNTLIGIVRQDHNCYYLMIHTESRLIPTSEEVPIHSGIPLLAYPMLCSYTPKPVAKEAHWIATIMLGLIFNLY